MIRTLTSIVILAFGLTACGKKPAPEPAPEKAAPVKVSIDAAPASDAAPPPPPPAPTETAPAAATGQKVDTTVDTTQVNPKREDQMEKWLAKYQSGDAAQKAQVVKEIRAANLTAAEKALMENTRSRYGYQKIPTD